MCVCIFRGCARIGMAKCTWPTGTRLDPTLLGRVLPDPFIIWIGSGFSLKRPKRVRVDIPGPNPTRIYNIYKIKNKKTLSISTHFSNPKSLRPILSPSHSLPHPHSHSHSHMSKTVATYFPGTAAPCIPHLAGLSSLPPSPCRSLQTPLLFPHFIVNSSCCNENRSFCSKNQICNF